mgnify:CR=1 FL=1
MSDTFLTVLRVPAGGLPPAEWTEEALAGLEAWEKRYRARKLTDYLGTKTLHAHLERVRSETPGLFWEQLDGGGVGRSYARQYGRAGTSVLVTMGIHGKGESLYALVAKRVRTLSGGGVPILRLEALDEVMALPGVREAVEGLKDLLLPRLGLAAPFLEALRPVPVVRVVERGLARFLFVLKDDFTHVVLDGFPFPILPPLTWEMVEHTKDPLDLASILMRRGVELPSEDLAAYLKGRKREGFGTRVRRAFLALPLRPKPSELPKSLMWNDWYTHLKEDSPEPVWWGGSKVFPVLARPWEGEEELSLGEPVSAGFLGVLKEIVYQGWSSCREAARAFLSALSAFYPRAQYALPPGFEAPVPSFAFEGEGYLLLSSLEHGVLFLREEELEALTRLSPGAVVETKLLGGEPGGPDDPGEPLLPERKGFIPRDPFRRSPIQVSSPIPGFVPKEVEATVLAGKRWVYVLARIHRGLRLFGIPREDSPSPGLGSLLSPESARTLEKALKAGEEVFLEGLHEWERAPLGVWVKDGAAHYLWRRVPAGGFPWRADRPPRRPPWKDRWLSREWRCHPRTFGADDIALERVGPEEVEALVQEALEEVLMGLAGA